MEGRHYRSSRREALQVVLHALSAHCVCWAAKCLKWTIEGEVAERGLEGAVRVATLSMNELGVVVSSTRLAVLGRHGWSARMALAKCLQLLGALHVRVPLARALATDLLCRESLGLVNKSSLHCKSDCLCWAGQHWLKVKNRAEERCSGRRAADVCRACLSTQNLCESGQGDLCRVRGSSMMSGEKMHNSSEVRMALLQHQQATL